MTTTLRIFLIAVAMTGPTSSVLARSPATGADDMRFSLPATSHLRHVTATGTTKPDGAALDGRLGTSPLLEAADRRLHRVVRTAICRGC